ncbi:DUF4260 domain-containing protein [Gracilibacillus saliphilus]|uniref:DUF4260 domain-containing protein n=1 Tax=Gracilibacillus saliphilus TaxID=543890 RepID=UPI0013D4A3C3|nr:DUF4260 domain-containing protein [Gracilibacillus saliphilus]
MNKLLLHLEGTAVFALSLYAYFYFSFGWLMLVLLLLAPDLAMLGYLINNKVGSIIYNLFHTYVLSLCGVVIGFLFHDLLLAISLIWTAHIGMDRMVGYGLKYSSGFKDTHFDRV